MHEMVRRKERIIIFGAGVGGRRAFRCLRHRCKILAFADNDSRKYGKQLLGRPIVSAAALRSMKFDAAYIASMYAPQIYSQLVDKLQMDPLKIVTVRQDILSGEYEVSYWSIAVLIFLGILALAFVVAAGLLAWRWLATPLPG
jgi:FlaA1/EpsC-like NDP-sugar epimerase